MRSSLWKSQVNTKNIGQVLHNIINKSCLERGMLIVKVIMYLPDSESALNELSDKVTKVHLDAVVNYISRLTCPKEQRTALIDAVIDELHEKHDNGR